ncbi:hypothetical protein J4051_14660 [Gelidibacter sp. DF109]|uniref:Carboxypeptidase-like protein n=1 Tax=Gelidibacter pelagius TaxID=2819985 RepID=A0ABS3SV02_9FLAO|nr:hypothetical protein [Gelidibacter pelagius]
MDPTFIILSLFFVINAHSQSVDIKGKINAPHEVDGIHIINKTANRFTISNNHGEFVIQAKLNDTILFSGISYQPKEIIITKLIIASKEFTVYLEELVNVLDEVLVGKILTGDLSSDIANSGVERDINFFDLGIPGFTGKPLTQSERRLKEASGLDLTLGGSTGGGGVGMSINPIINGISGRTKRLKEQVRLEKMDECITKIKSDLSDILFKFNGLDKDYRVEFFYYCADDPKFATLCAFNDDFKTLEFLKGKLISFKTNIQTKPEE